MDYSAARFNMVECQVRPNRVTDPGILTAMAEVPRERFLPRNLRGIAYVDDDIPLGGGRYLMEPMVLGRLLQAAEIRPGEVALNIGAGVGYEAAILARLATTVVAIESDRALAERAGRTMSELSIDNVVVVEGPLSAGYPRQAPYDVIFFGGAVERIPPEIIDQLSANGRLVAVVAPQGEPGRATLVMRLGEAVSRRTLFDASIPRLPGFAQQAGFVF